MNEIYAYFHCLWFILFKISNRTEPCCWISRNWAPWVCCACWIYWTCKSISCFFYFSSSVLISVFTFLLYFIVQYLLLYSFKMPVCIYIFIYIYIYIYNSMFLILFLVVKTTAVLIISNIFTNVNFYHV